MQESFSELLIASLAVVSNIRVHLLLCIRIYSDVNIIRVVEIHLRMSFQHDAQDHRFALPGSDDQITEELSFAGSGADPHHITGLAHVTAGNITAGFEFLAFGVYFESFDRLRFFLRRFCRICRFIRFFKGHVHNGINGSLALLAIQPDHVPVDKIGDVLSCQVGRNLEVHSDFLHAHAIGIEHGLINFEHLCFSLFVLQFVELVVFASVCVIHVLPPLRES